MPLDLHYGLRDPGAVYTHQHMNHYYTTRHTDAGFCNVNSFIQSYTCQSLFERRKGPERLCCRAPRTVTAARRKSSKSQIQSHQGIKKKRKTNPHTSDAFWFPLIILEPHQRRKVAPAVQTCPAPPTYSGLRRRENKAVDTLKSRNGYLCVCVCATVTVKKFPMQVRGRERERLPKK